MTLIRLNKYLASVGVASRRKVDELTQQGRILINNQTAVLGDKIDPNIDVIQVDKKIIASTPTNLIYYALNKPKFVLSSAGDDRGRQSVVDYVPETPRVFPVGRLDYESTGLIILTNDGDFSLRVTHPRFHLPKTYLVTVLGKVPVEKINQMKDGVNLDDGQTAPAHVEFNLHEFNQTVLKITLFEGKKRQIRRMCSALRLHLIDLHRISIGQINIGDLRPGEYRLLTPQEIKIG